MKRVLLTSAFALLGAGTCGPAQAERISNPIAMFAGLDKITGVTTTFEIPIGQERRFGSVIVKPDVCYTRPVTEEPKTTSFVQIDQVEMDDIAQAHLLRLDVRRKPRPQRHGARDL